jgi:hypothetical protein
MVARKRSLPFHTVQDGIKNLYCSVIKNGIKDLKHLQQSFILSTPSRLFARSEVQMEMIGSGTYENEKTMTAGHRLFRVSKLPTS